MAIKFTLVKTHLDDYPRYRVCKGEITSVDQIDPNMKVTRSYKNAADILVSELLRDPESPIKLVEFDQPIPDPVHEKKDKAEKKEESK